MRCFLLLRKELIYLANDTALKRKREPSALLGKL